MMTIREYLDYILETEGFEAYAEIEADLESAYCDDEDEEAFADLCAELGIDLSDREALQSWVWDFDE